MDVTQEIRVSILVSEIALHVIRNGWNEGDKDIFVEKIKKIMEAK